MSRMNRHPEIGWLSRLAITFLLLLTALPMAAMTAVAQDVTEVRLTHAPSSPAEQNVMKELIATCEAANPSIKVKYEPVTQEYNTKLQTDLAAGTAADIFAYDSLPAPDFIQAGVLTPLDEMMQSAGISTDKFYPGLIEAFQQDGQLYGIPKDFSTLAMIYDPSVFATSADTSVIGASPGAGSSPAAGTATSESLAVPQTWDELRQVAQTLKDQTGQAPIVYGPNFDRYIAFLYQAGASVISEDGSEIVINSPEAKQALDFYYGLYTDGLATTFQEVGAQWPGDAFAKGLASIVFEGPWLIGFMDENAPDKPYGIAELPAGPAGKATMAFTQAYGVNTASDVKDAAFQMIACMTGVEGMTQWSTGFGVLPSRPAVSEDYLARFPERAPFLAGGDYAKPWQLGPGGERFNTEANAELQALFAGQQDVQTTLDNMQSRAESIIRLS